MLAETRPDLTSAPSYATLRRFLKANGLDKRRRVTSRQTAGADRAEARLLDREVRSYEAAYVNGLWHWDCHHGSRKVLTARGEWQTPILFGVLDDRSRLACHLQWYLAETAEIVAHGLSQAFQKRGLPRSGLSDNGPAMTAAEITEGLTRLGILHQHHAALQPLPECQAGGVLGSGSRAGSSPCWRMSPISRLRSSTRRRRQSAPTVPTHVLWGRVSSHQRRWLEVVISRQRSTALRPSSAGES